MTPGRVRKISERVRAAARQVELSLRAPVAGWTAGR
jgi:hypothetical protein